MVLELEASIAGVLSSFDLRPEHLGCLGEGNLHARQLRDGRVGGVAAGKHCGAGGGRDCQRAGNCRDANDCADLGGFHPMPFITGRALDARKLGPYGWRWQFMRDTCIVLYKYSSCLANRWTGLLTPRFLEHSVTARPQRRTILALRGGSSTPCPLCWRPPRSADFRRPAIYGSKACQVSTEALASTFQPPTRARLRRESVQPRLRTGQDREDHAERSDAGRELSRLPFAMRSNRYVRSD